jgi:hypothetical protein
MRFSLPQRERESNLTNIQNQGGRRNNPRLRDRHCLAILSAWLPPNSGQSLWHHQPSIITVLDEAFTFVQKKSAKRGPPLKAEPESGFGHRATSCVIIVGRTVVTLNDTHQTVNAVATPTYR